MPHCWVALTAMLISSAATAQTCNHEWQPLEWIEVTGAPFPSASWAAEPNGVLRTIPSEDGRQDLRSTRAFRSFEFAWEWKASPGANSGVKYFIRKTDRWAAKNGKGYQARGRGAEYQMADDAGDRDAASNPARSTASLYSKLAPATSKHLKPIGEWNESRVVVNGAHVEHWLNGDKVLSYTEESPIESPIVLQNHNSVVWFRNLRIREICQ